MVVIRTVVHPDPDVRKSVVAAFTGPGAPVGVRACSESADTVSIRFDDDVTPPELIDDLITIESHFVTSSGRPDPGDAEAAQLAAAGLEDPELDVSRILETHLTGLE